MTGSRTRKPNTTSVKPVRLLKRKKQSVQDHGNYHQVFSPDQRGALRKIAIALKCRTHDETVEGLILSKEPAQNERTEKVSYQLSISK